MTLSHGSAFSGIGGAEIAAELAGGYEHAWAIEFAPYQHSLLERRYPGVRVETDVRTAVVPGVDVMTAGFPCQPFSVAGRRGGADDDRNMWPATARLIRYVRPRVALLENVPAIRNPIGREPSYFGTVLGDLATLGYDAAWDCVPASRVGAPHRRDRVWIVAWDARRVEPFDPFIHYRRATAPSVGAMWQTPTVGITLGGSKTRGGDRSDELLLPGQVAAAMWQTPRENEARGGGYTYSRGDHDSPFLTLTGQARVAMWATPTAQQPGGTAEQFLERKRKAREGGVALGVALTDLQMQAQEAMWPTPRESEHKGTGPLGSASQAHRLEHGYLDATVQEATQRSGVLNPEWVELLMGYPRGWTDLEAESGEPTLCAWPASDLRVGDVAFTHPDYAQHWLGPVEGPWPLAKRTKATTPRLSSLGNSWVPQVAAPILAAVREALS